MGFACKSDIINESNKISIQSECCQNNVVCNFCVEFESEFWTRNYMDANISHMYCYNYVHTIWILYVLNIIKNPIDVLKRKKTYEKSLLTTTGWTHFVDCELT